jgi:hypothetical protein
MNSKPAMDRNMESKEWFVGLESPEPLQPKPQFSLYRSNRFCSPNLDSFKKGRHGWTPVIEQKGITPVNQRIYFQIPKTKIESDDTASAGSSSDSDFGSPSPDDGDRTTNTTDLQTQHIPEGINWSPIRS